MQQRKTKTSGFTKQLIAMVIIQAVLSVNCAGVFASNIEKSTLAPSVQVNISNFINSFNSKYDTSITKGEIFSQISDKIIQALRENQIGHQTYDDGLRKNYQRMLLLAINKSRNPRRAGLNFLENDASNAFGELLNILINELELPQGDIAKIIAEPVVSNNAKEVFESLAQFARLVLKDKSLSKSNRAQLLTSISQKPNLIKQRLKKVQSSEAAQKDLFSFLMIFNKAGFLDGGINIYFIMPQNYKKHISTEAIALVLSLDEYVHDYYRREGQDVNQSLIKPYFAGKDGKPNLKVIQFTQLRYLVHRAGSSRALLRQLTEFIKKNKITNSEVMRAYLRNAQNEIISQSSDLILYLDKASSDKAGLPDNMESLESKIHYEIFTDKQVYRFFKKLKINITETMLNEELLSNGFRMVKAQREKLIVPVVFDVMLSAYRGSAENDHQEAGYFTHAVSTAILNYAARRENEGTQWGSDLAAYGVNAFHEIDNLLPLIDKTRDLDLEGKTFDQKLAQASLKVKNSRNVDNAVSLAYSHADTTIPDWWRKRTISLASPASNGGSTIADHLEQLQQWQSREAQAKVNIYEILKILRSGLQTKQELELAIKLLQNNVNTLRNHCGLKRAYFDALFSIFDQQFFNQLRSNHDFLNPANNNKVIKTFLEKGFFRSVGGIGKYQAVVESFYRDNGFNAEPYLVQHPWIKSKITIMDYLRSERNIRKGTFEDSIKPNISYRILYKYANMPAQQDELFYKYESEHKIIEHKRNFITDSETGPEVLKAQINDELLRDADTLSPERIMKVARKNKYLDGLFNASDTKMSTSEDHTLGVMNAYLKFFGKEKLPASISKKLFLTILLLHDIGKPQAKSLGGSRNQQHIYTERVIESIKGMLPFTDTEINFIKAFVKIDPIGSYLKSSIRGGSVLDNSEKDIRNLADEFNVPVEDLFDLILIYYQVDVASRTRLFTTGKAPARSYENNMFDNLFEYTEDKTDFIFENSKRLKFSSQTLGNFRFLERKIKGTAFGDNGQSGPVLAEEQLQVSSKKNSRTGIFRHEVMLGSEKLVVRSSQEMYLRTKVDEIAPGLFVGNAVAALQHKSLGIDSILNVADEVHFFDLGLQEEADYKKIRLKEGYSNIIAAQDIQEAVKYIDQQISQGKKVMVNCRVGMARSVSIILAYLYYKNPKLNFLQIQQEFFKITKNYNMTAHKGLEESLQVLYPRGNTNNLSLGAVNMRKVQNNSSFAINSAI